MKNLSVLQKIFTVLGFIGFLLLIPGLLFAAGWTSLPESLTSTFGAAGSLPVITLIAFVLMALMFIFGGGHNISATFVGYLIGFFLISTAVDIGFMGWFKNWTSNIAFLSVPQLNYIVGNITVVVGVLMSFNKKIPLIGELAGLVVLPIGFLLLTSYLGILRFEGSEGFNIEVNKGVQYLTEMIDEKYRNMNSVKDYVEEVHEDEDLTEEEKEDKIKKLQDKIKKMEEDQRILEELKKQNEEYQERLKDQKKNLKDFGWCASSKDSSKMVSSIVDAVVPGQPCVRDFAVSLVKKESGPYSDQQKLVPSETGLRQICALHMHLASNWSYVNDPMVLRDDFYSPADRSIAVGLAGDCDDFATLNASCIEAIGGAARIMVGKCSGGGHGWAEVLIGKKEHWDRAVRVIRDYYNKPRMKLKPLIDENGVYWLSLDWIIGQYSCNDYGTEEWYNSKEQSGKSYK